MRPVFPFSLFFFFFAVLFPQILTADTPETCQAHYGVYQANVLRRLDRVEDSYARYRWTEFSLRKTFYDRLWLARLEGNDPLDREKREAGQREEKRLIGVIRDLQKRSEKKVSLIFADLDALTRSDSEAPRMCALPSFRTCLLKANGPMIDQLEALRKAVGEILEHDREYAAVVLDASGGKDGLYPQDVLEPAVEHSDAFWRFESPRSQERFTDDSRVLNILTEIRTLLTVQFSGDSCCFRCV